MNILNRGTIGTLVVGLGLSSYTPQRPVSATEIKQKQIISELTNNTFKGVWEPCEYKRETAIQRSLDSIAYKQIFDGTQLANDSNVVKEFNKISQLTAPGKRHALYPLIQSDLDQVMLGMGCSPKEVNGMRKDIMNAYPVRDCGEIHFTAEGTIRAVARHQYLTDSVAYSKFFKNNGILNSTVKKQIASIARKIKP